MGSLPERVLDTFRVNDMNTQTRVLLLLISFVLGFRGSVLAQKTSPYGVMGDAGIAQTATTELDKEITMPKPKVLLFDVNETLLDLAPLKISVGIALGGREDLLPLWFSTMLHYSLVETFSGNYHSFEEIGTAALKMVAETQGIELEYQEAKVAVVTPLRSLPPHHDVAVGLKLLSEAGFRIVSLTNSSAEGAETQLRNAGLTDLFEKRFSIESIKKYKPHPDTYRMVIHDLSVRPEEILMVAAHAWDLAGAKNVGLQTAFILRPGTALYPNVAKPDYVMNDLPELVKRLREVD